MPRISFTQNLQRHVACPSAELAGATVRDVLEAYFAAHPAVRGYIVDEHGALRQHIAVFVQGKPIRDRVSQGDAAPAGAEIHVMQALSGG